MSALEGEEAVAGLRAALDALTPGDEREADDLAEARALVQSGAPLIRSDVARPDPHLVSYTLVTDGARLLLGQHRNAGLWLPMGGHVEAGERPRDAALRELREEVGEALPLLTPTPFFLTLQQTRGPQPHRDLSLWFAFGAAPEQCFAWDRAEFVDLRWFTPAALPACDSTAQLERASKKLRAAGHLRL